MAEPFTRGVCKLWNTPLFSLLRTSSIRPPYLDIHGRSLFANLTQIRNKTVGGGGGGSGVAGRLDLGNSSQNKGNLYAALQVGKSSKKIKSKRKHLNQSVALQKRQEYQQQQLFPNKKTGTKNSKGDKASKSTVSAKNGVTSSFLASCNNPRACSKQTKCVNKQLTNEIGGRSTSNLEKGTNNKMNTLFNNGSTVALSQKTSDQSFGLGKTPIPQALKNFDNYTALKNVPLQSNVVVDKNDRKNTADLDLLDLDLTGGAKWTPEENHWSEFIELSKFSNKNKSKSVRNRTDFMENGAVNVNKDKLGNDLRVKELPEDLSYEHLLYNEKRYQNKNSVNKAVEANDTNVKTQFLDVLPVSNTNKTESSKVQNNVEEKNKNSMNAEKNKSSNGFILVKEDGGSATQSTKGEKGTKPSKFDQELYAWIQSLRNNTWEADVQKSLDAARKKESSSFVLVNEKPSSRDKDSTKSHISKEKISTYALSRNPGVKSSQNVSTVPNNTAQLPSKVRVEELKADVKKKSKSLPTGSISEPVLTIQPGEIVNRKKQSQQAHMDKTSKNNLSTKHKERENTLVAPTGKKEELVTGLSPNYVHNKPSSSKSLMAMVEKEQKQSDSSGQELAKQRKEIWSSSSKLLNMKREKHNKKENKQKWGNAVSINDLIKKDSSIGFCTPKQTSLIPAPPINVGTNERDLKGTANSEQSSKGNKKHDLLKELRKELKHEFRESFLQMQRDDLIKMGLNPKPKNTTSSLMYTPNSQAKWLSDTLEKAEQNKIKGGNINVNKLLESLPSTVSSTKENWQFNQNQERVKQKPSKVKASKDSDKNEYGKGQGKSKEMLTGSIDRFEEFSNQKDAMFYKEMTQQSHPGTKSQSLFPTLEKLDGIMTMNLIPVHDSTPPTPPPIKMAADSGTQSAMSRNHQALKEMQEMQLQRNLLAMRRYQERRQMEKEERKKKKKKNRKRKNKGQSEAIISNQRTSKNTQFISV